MGWDLSKGVSTSGHCAALVSRIALMSACIYVKLILGLITYHEFMISLHDINHSYFVDGFFLIHYIRNLSYIIIHPTQTFDHAPVTVRELLCIQKTCLPYKHGALRAILMGGGNVELHPTLASSVDFAYRSMSMIAWYSSPMCMTCHLTYNMFERVSM